MTTKNNQRVKGTIYQRSNGRWVGKYTHRWDMNGKRRKKTVTAATRRQVSEKLRDAIRAGHAPQGTPYPAPLALQAAEQRGRRSTGILHH